ncbi:hypothetical protein C170_00104 [Paenibacillus sp. FSL H7-689]|nr:hypothetical protein C170_00104 [Paenibacillus sp. FSL H7-689]
MDQLHFYQSLKCFRKFIFIQGQLFGNGTVIWEWDRNYLMFTPSCRKLKITVPTSTPPQSLTPQGFIAISEIKITVPKTLRKSPENWKETG